MIRALLVLSSIVALQRPSGAEPSHLASDSWTYQRSGTIAVDAGLTVGLPTALPTGLARGIGAGVTLGGCPFRWGARAAWVTATESTMAWSVTHSDLRLRLTGAVEQAAGRGTFGLRLGAGGTLVHESRVRSQGARAGLTGSELETSTFTMVPAADLELVVSLHVLGPWLLIVSGGPSLALVDGEASTAWIGQLGVAWQP